MQKSTTQCALTGARICLIFEHSLSHYTRLLQEIRALQAAGATVQLLTAHGEDEPLPPGVDRTVAPLTLSLPGSELAWRPLRVADNLLRTVIRAALARHPQRASRVRRRELRRIAGNVDLMWVIDFPSLPSALSEARRAGVPVVYETVDLVPEYQYLGDRHRRRALALEHQLIYQVDGFITACDSYADYYVEHYGQLLKRRPVVRNNMPEHISMKLRQSQVPLRFLFLGSLMFDRPVLELIQAMALVHSNVTLTLQGKNYLGTRPQKLVDQLGLQQRVRILDPCPPNTIVETAAQYDVGIVALRGENENERRASTSKLFTFMAAGLAILGSNLPGIARLVRRYGNGMLVEGFSPADWATSIDRFAQTPLAEVDAMKQRSLAAAEIHSWEREQVAYIHEFQRALACSTRSTKVTENLTQR